MEYASFKIVDNKEIRSIISIKSSSTPVWSQARWNSGEYQEFIRNNGCGHCCVAMALNLNNIKITPHEEFVKCVSLWGLPNANQQYPQKGYQTVCGISKILNHYGIKAEYYGVPSRESASENIENALKNGKQVIFWSHPNSDFTENPFSQGEHYVMAVGYTNDGEILVANSSEKCAVNGVQLVNIQTIVKSLLLGANPQDLTWGESGPRERCAGYVIVG